MTCRRWERGSVSPLVLYGSVLVCVMGIGGATIGRIVHARREVQNVADSAALFVADQTREQGLQANRAPALQLAQRNSQAPATATLDGVSEELVGTDKERLVIATRSGQTVDTPRFVFDGDSQVQARAKAKVDQERRTIPPDTTAEVVLALDYSGSMSGQPIATLEDALTGHLNDNRILLAYAAALFSDTLVGEVPFEADSIHKILHMFQDKDASGGTRPEFAFDKAREFLGAPSMGSPPRFVVFVSDGAPNDPASAYAGSKRLWDESEPTVMTIHIGGGGEARGFMVDVSGKHDDRGNADYYFPVSDMQSFRRALAEILSRIACPIEKLTGSRIKDPNTVRAFLQDRAGREVKLQRIEDLAGNPDALGFFYNPQTFDIAVTIEACVLMRSERRALVVRYNRAQLVE